MQVNKWDALNKAVEVFYSCRTLGQLVVATRYGERVLRLFARESAETRGQVVGLLDRSRAGAAGFVTL